VRHRSAITPEKSPTRQRSVGRERSLCRIAKHSPTIFVGIPHFPLAFSPDQSDQSSCAKQAQKRIPTHMTTAETTPPDKAAAVGAQGAHVAPEKAPATNAASQRKGAPKAKKAANGAKE